MFELQNIYMARSRSTITIDLSTGPLNLCRFIGNTPSADAGLDCIYIIRRIKGKDQTLYLKKNK